MTVILFVLGNYSYKYYDILIAEDRPPGVFNFHSPRTRQLLQHFRALCTLNAMVRLNQE